SFSTVTTSHEVPAASRWSLTLTGTQPSEIAAWSSAMTGSSPQPAMEGCSVAHRSFGDLPQELLVRLGLADLVDEQLQAGRRFEGMEHAAKPPRQRQLFGRHEPLFLSSPRGLDVDGREHPLLGQAPVQSDLPVPGALELLEDDLVHAGPRFHQGARDDGQRTP